MNILDYHVVEVEALEGNNVRLRFRNGVEKEVDLTPFLRGPVFELIRRDREVFESMEIQGGTLTWNTGADIDPLVLYFGSEDRAREEIMTHRRRSPNRKTG